MRAGIAWTVVIDLDPEADHTEARAHLEAKDMSVTGWGRARRNPEDPNVPLIGEELAAARALSDLSHKLVEEAALKIEAAVGGSVTIH